jgi:DNA (cytosine-5)-methyltransferase 1
VARSSRPWESKAKRYSMIDLFCGAGGLSLGFEYHGVQSKLAVDFDEQAIETYNFNRKHKVGIVKDVNELTEALAEVDLVIGGPPCQGFSNANRQRLIDDPRNQLYKQFIRLVDLYQPKAVLMENVVGIKHRADEIIEDYLSIGYYASFVELNAIQFKIPQNRKRVFFFACKYAEYAQRFKEKLEAVKKHDGFVLKDALSGLRVLKAKQIKNNTAFESEDVGYTEDSYTGSLDKAYAEFINRKNKAIGFMYNHKSRYNNERDIEIFRRLPQGANSTHESIANIMPYRRRNHVFKDKYFKLDETKPCKTITAHMKYDCNMYIHPTQARGLTPREAARIQTFPDEYVFKGSYTRWYKQIGNAVPPMLAYYIAQEILSYELFGQR